MSSKIKLGDCPRMVNSTDARRSNNCFDDCLNDFRWDWHNRSHMYCISESLKYSYRCSSALKCCWINSCNRSCVMAENLNRISTFALPSIPTNISVISIEHELRRKVKIMWFMRIPYNHSGDEHIEYVLEARAHIGNTFSKHKLGHWFVLQADNINIESTHSHNFKYVQSLPILL